MRIHKQLLLSALVFALPIASAVTKDGTDVGVQVNYETAQGPDGARISSRPSSLSPSYILEGIQNTYMPSALRMTGAIQAFMEPKTSSFDFWEEAKKSEKKLQAYVHRLLEAGATYFKSTKFTDVATAMNHIVNATATFRDDIKGALDAHNITLDTMTKELEGVFMMIVHDFENIPPPDKAPGHAERAEMVDKVLDDTTVGLTELATRYGIDEDVVTNYLHVLRPQVQALTVAIGDINEQHPQLLPALAFSVAILLIPGSWILRPFLSVFGFGPGGPVKGSAAAWMQRRLWGAAVASGSWFAWLQAAGMGILPKWSWIVTKVPLWIGALLAMLLPCFKRG